MSALSRVFAWHIAPEVQDVRTPLPELTPDEIRAIGGGNDNVIMYDSDGCSTYTQSASAGPNGPAWWDELDA